MEFSREPRTRGKVSQLDGALSKSSGPKRAPCLLYPGSGRGVSARVFGRRHFLRVLRLETWLSHIIYHLHGWKTDGVRMANNVRELRSRSSDSEKITINLGYVDLGNVDLLVQEGFYSNRTDFIRTAIRNQLDRQNESVKQSVARHQLELGLRHYSRADLEAFQAAGETLHIQVLGLASIADDVSPELALRTIASIHVLGALHMSSTLKAALSNRIR
jgi:Arc/MetJ-type ribon-helix-helix transcriptional regulator